jgi:hypothetical protein
MDRVGRTKADTWVLITNILTLLICEEHVGGETTLGRVGIFKTNQYGGEKRIGRL